MTGIDSELSRERVTTVVSLSAYILYNPLPLSSSFESDGRKMIFLRGISRHKCATTAPVVRRRVGIRRSQCLCGIDGADEVHEALWDPARGTRRLP